MIGIWIGWVVPDALRRIQGSGVFLWILLILNDEFVGGYDFGSLMIMSLDLFGIMVLKLSVVIPSASKN